MKTGYGTVGIVVMATLVVAGTALAAPPTGGRGRENAGPGWQGRGNHFSRPGMMGAMAHRLNLTDDQNEKIRDITQQARAEGQEIGQALVKARKAFNDVVADGAEEEQIRGAAESLAKAMANQAIHRSRTRASIRESLTEEQRKQLAESQERLGRFGGRPMDSGAFGRPQRGRDGRGRGWAHPASRMGRPDRGLRSENGPRRPRQGPPMGPMAQRGRVGRGRQVERGPRTAERRRGPASDERSRGSRGGPMGGRGAQGRGPEFLDRMFDRADANDDGMLSQDELKAFRDEMPRRQR